MGRHGTKDKHLLLLWYRASSILPSMSQIGLTNLGLSSVCPTPNRNSVFCCGERGFSTPGSVAIFTPGSGVLPCPLCVGLTLGRISPYTWHPSGHPNFEF